MTIKHTDDSLNACNFADRHPGWHTFGKDKRTERAIERARVLGAVEVNEFHQFRRAPNRAASRDVTADIKLSSGRVIGHYRAANGSQNATPKSGPEEMTEEEWQEYCRILASGVRQVELASIMAPEDLRD